MTFIETFYGLCLVCFVVYFYTKKKEENHSDPTFNSFQATYLVVYLLAIAGDWLQGPHVYALYESYGMTKHEIELLFVAGFASSLLFGTVVGSFADKFGRRNNCLLYALLYICSCITKHFANFYILMVGRFLGGIATSILYSAFESWLVCEHHTRNFSEGQLRQLFKNAAFGNSLVAVLAGIAAQFVADHFGIVAPFDLSLSILCMMSLILINSWTENFGDEKTDVSTSLLEAFNIILSDGRVFCLGLAQSLFEGAMYTFVLEWTPALSQSGDHSPIPHGYIFASFMVATMIGASSFTFLTKFSQPEKIMVFVFLISAGCLSVPILTPTDRNAIFASFVTFEMCVGIFWPAMGYQRSIYVAEKTRSTTLNLFRIPLNLIVIGILFLNLSMLAIFKFCVGFLLLAAFAQFSLSRLSQTTISFRNMSEKPTSSQ